MPIVIATLLRKFWPLILAGGVALGLIVALAITRHTLAKSRQALTAEKQAHNLDIETWSAASARAIADATTAARNKEQRDATISKESQDELTKQIAAARANAAAYAARLQRGATTDRSGPGKADMSNAGSASANPPGAGQGPVLDEDLAICSENTVKAQGWQDWYRRIAEPVSGISR